jgi:16S rRNA (cytosine1402-N4)-methyltransferase
LTENGDIAAAGAPHTPVLLDRVMHWLAPQSGGIYLDATFGAGGYSRAILNCEGTRVIAIDRDADAIRPGARLVAEATGRLTLAENRFSQLADVAATHGAAAVDGVVMDIGVSSMQLDTAARGFSFRLDGPLDMRMGRHGPSAADVIARASEADLAKVIFTLGEERFSRQIARAVVKARADAPIATTKALADIVAGVVRIKPGDIHPATRTFQALRILVNEELDELLLALEGAEQILKPGGRLVVVSFHSLEDRIVKNFLGARGKIAAGSRHQPELKHAAPSFRILTKRPEVAGAVETARNPRARSAKLRAAERTDASPHAAQDPSSPWPRLGDVMGRA